MNITRAKQNLAKISPRVLTGFHFTRAYSTDVVASLGRKHFFDCSWSYERGYRYNFKRTCPTLYLAADEIVASAEIGPRRRLELLGALKPRSPLLYVSVAVSAQILDLTDRVVRRTLGTNLKELLVSTEKWNADMKMGKWSATHHLGFLSLEDGRFDGVLYPPFPWRKILRQRGKYNLALFMDEASAGMATPRHPRVKLGVTDPRGVLASLGLIV